MTQTMIADSIDIVGKNAQYDEALCEGFCECGGTEGLLSGLCDFQDQEVEERFSHLIRRLMDEKRYGELKQASEDRKFREKLFVELGIE